MERFFISDTHFGHRNIIEFQKRPFSNEHEMDDFICTMWNQTVKNNDHITHLGDITMNRGGHVQREAFIKLVRSLNGHKRLAMGNHDHFPIKVYLEAGFEKIYATWRDEQGILFSHMPVHPTSLGSAKANCHGHTHGAPDITPVMYVDKDQRLVVKPFVNISLERTNYLPINYDQLMDRINQAKTTGEITNPT